MKWAMVVMLVVIAVMPLAARGQTLDGYNVTVTQVTDAEVAGVVTEARTTTDCDAEVCADRALDPRCDTRFWNGMAWCPAKPVNNDGDIAPKTYVRFTRAAIQNGYFIRHTAMLDIRPGKDEAYVMWEIDPNALRLQPDQWYRVYGGDKNKCQSSGTARNYYTHSEGVVPGNFSNRESVNREFFRKCDGGHWL